MEPSNYIHKTPGKLLLITFCIFLCTSLAMGLLLFFYKPASPHLLKAELYDLSSSSNRTRGSIKYEHNGFKVPEGEFYFKPATGSITGKQWKLNLRSPLQVGKDCYAFIEGENLPLPGSSGYTQKIIEGHLVFLAKDDKGLLGSLIK